MPTDQNLFRAFAQSWQGRADATALAEPGGPALAFSALDQESARLAGLLASLGVRAGDRLTLQAPKSPAWLCLYLACLRSGVVFHPLNDDYQPAELAFFLADAEPALAVCVPERAALFAELTGGKIPVLTLDAAGRGSLSEAAAGVAPRAVIHPSAADDVAVLLYSSGTTGRPKGALVTHGNLLSNARTLVDCWEFTASDRLLHALPVYHAHGLFVGVGCALLGGASLRWLPRFSAGEVLRELPGCSVFMGVPTHYVRLLAEPGLDRAACRSVRLFVSGSAPLPPAVFAGFEARTGQRILERYGMTETGMNSANPLPGERRPGSVGRPLPGIDIRVVGETGQSLPAGQVGQIEIRGPNVFRGYWRAPGQTAAAFTADGWFRSGDQGSFSADGYLSIAGRSKDLVISGGLNVYPREVEVELEQLPGVRDAAVIGAPHPDFGEGVVAVLAAGEDAPDEVAVIAALRARLAAYKLPKRVFFLPELPRNTMGKVQKNVLRQMFAETFQNSPDA